jgi:hypothetical protein
MKIHEFVAVYKHRNLVLHCKRVVKTLELSESETPYLKKSSSQMLNTEGEISGAIIH